MSLAILGFLVGIAYLPIPSAYATPRWLVVQVGCAAILLVTPIRMTTAHWAGAAFLVWCAMSTAWSASFQDTIGAVIQLSALAAAFCVAAETEDLVPFWLALGAAAAINTVLALFQVSGSLTLFSPPRGLVTDPVGLFGNKNFFANFAVVAFIGTASMLGNFWEARLKSIAAWVLTIFAAVAILMTSSRGAMLALFVALAFWGWRGTGRGWTLFFVAAMLLVASAAALEAVDLTLHPWRMDKSVDFRLVTWQLALANLTPFGWGFGTYGTIFPFEHAFSDPVETVFELGIGSIFFGVFCAICLGSRAPGIEWTIFVAVLVESFFAFPLHQAATAMVAAVCSGRLSRRYRDARHIEHRGGDHGVRGIQDARPFPTRAIRETDFGSEVVSIRPEYSERR